MTSARPNGLACTKGSARSMAELEDICRGEGREGRHDEQRTARQHAALAVWDTLRRAMHNIEHFRRRQKRRGAGRCHVALAEPRIRDCVQALDATAWSLRTLTGPFDRSLGGWRCQRVRSRRARAVLARMRQRGRSVGVCCEHRISLSATPNL